MAGMVRDTAAKAALRSGWAGLEVFIVCFVSSIQRTVEACRPTPPLGGKPRHGAPELTKHRPDRPKLQAPPEPRFARAANAWPRRMLQRVGTGRRLEERTRSLSAAPPKSKPSEGGQSEQRQSGWLGDKHDVVQIHRNVPINVLARTAIKLECERADVIVGRRQRNRDMAPAVGHIDLIVHTNGVRK